MTYYNEFNPNAAQWLRNLQAEGLIPRGVVDERSITEVRGSDVAGHSRVHFFSGIGGWERALELAGWDPDEEVWTGSAPCQPFSQAGKRGGAADARHLWPEMFRLIVERRPRTIFGEQVSSKDGLAWLDGVCSDLEGAGYTVGAVVVGAHSVGAPHIRKRLYWCARRGVEHDTERDGWGRRRDADQTGEQRQIQIAGLGSPCGVADAPMSCPIDGRVQCGGLERLFQKDGSVDGTARDCERAPACGVADSAHEDGRTGERGAEAGTGENAIGGRGPASSGSWSDSRLVPCTDGKARRTGSGVFPLAHGIPRSLGEGRAWRKGLARGASSARRGMLHGSGNAIIPELAADFIMSCMEVML